MYIWLLQAFLSKKNVRVKYLFWWLSADSFCLFCESTTQYFFSHFCHLVSEQLNLKIDISICNILILIITEKTCNWLYLLFSLLCISRYQLIIEFNCGILSQWNYLSQCARCDLWSISACLMVSVAITQSVASC